MSHLDDTQGGGGDRVREITTRRGHGAHDGDRALPVRGAQALDLAGALVERGETGTEVGGVARVGGHLGQTTRDLTQGLGPSGSRVAHHRKVVAHVTVVLGKGDAGVNGGLTGGHGHVGGVGDQGCPLHDGLLASVRQSKGQLGELLKNLGHLVATLAASNVDDAVLHDGIDPV